MKKRTLSVLLLVSLLLSILSFSVSCTTKTSQGEIVTLNQLASQVGVASSSKSKTDADTSRHVISNGKSRPIITFIDDDARDSFPDRWNPIIEETGISISCSIITNKVGDYQTMTWEELEHEASLGVDMLMHGSDHVDFRALSSEERISNIVTAKEAMRAHGFRDDVNVMPFNYYNAEVIADLQPYLNAVVVGRVSSKECDINVPPVVQYRLSRMPLTNDREEDQIPLKALKAYVDQTVEENGWLIFVSHSYQVTEKRQREIIELINYAQKSGAEIMNMHDALEVFGNVVYSGEFGYGENTDYFVVDCNGVVHYSESDKYVKKQTISIGAGEKRYIETHGEGTAWLYVTSVVKSQCYTGLLYGGYANNPSLYASIESLHNGENVKVYSANKEGSGNVIVINNTGQYGGHVTLVTITGSFLIVPTFPVYKE